MKDFEVYTFAPGEQGSKEGLHEYLSALYETDRWRSIRGGLAELVAFAGLPCWILAMWPHAAEGGWRALALLIFAFLTICFAGSIGMELRWRRRRERFQARSKPIPDE